MVAKLDDMADSPLAAPGRLSLHVANTNLQDLSKRANHLWLFAGILVLLAIGAGLAVMRLARTPQSREPAMLQCERMVQALQTGVDPDALRAAATTLINKYPSGPAHSVDPVEQPKEVNVVVRSLGLAEVLVCDDILSNQRILCMDSPGGFGSYGVKVMRTGNSGSRPVQTYGLTQLVWKDGICVFYFTP
jgi:hypothetical protein